MLHTDILDVYVFVEKPTVEIHKKGEISMDMMNDRTTDSIEVLKYGLVFTYNELQITLHGKCNVIYS